MTRSWSETAITTACRLWATATRLSRQVRARASCTFRAPAQETCVWAKVGPRSDDAWPSLRTAAAQWDTPTTRFESGGQHRMTSRHIRRSVVQGGSKRLSHAAGLGSRRKVRSEKETSVECQ